MACNEGLFNLKMTGKDDKFSSHRGYLIISSYLGEKLISYSRQPFFNGSRQHLALAAHHIKREKKRQPTKKKTNKKPQKSVGKTLEYINVCCV